MRPVLFTIRDIPVPAYGVLYVTAFLAAIFTGAYLASRNGFRFWTIVDVSFITAIGGEIGSRLTFLLVEWDRIVSGGITLGQFFSAGRVVLGGVAAGLATLIWQIRRHRLPVALFSDIGLTATTLGMAIGRLGCLLAGCCYGNPTELGWGITFTDELAHRYNGTPLGEALHPTQAIQALEGFALFFVLLWIFARRRFDGQAAGMFWILTGATRFLVEFLRGDPRGMALGLATSQWIGLAGIVFGAVWLWVVARKPALRSRA